MIEPVIGDTRMYIMPSGQQHKQIFAECPICHKGKWSYISHGIPSYPMHKSCSGFSGWSKPESKDNHSKGQIERWSRAEQREHQRIKMLEWHEIPESKEIVHSGLIRCFSDKTRITKMSEAQKGKKSHLWKGGISYEPYTPEFNNQLKESVRERDNYTCQLCGMKQNGIKLDVHHIDYDKQHSKEDNLISLCHTCHTKTSHRREYWTRFFQTKIKEADFNPPLLLSR